MSSGAVKTFWFHDEIRNGHGCRFNLGNPRMKVAAEMLEDLFLWPERINGRFSLIPPDNPCDGSHCADFPQNRLCFKNYFLRHQDGVNTVVWRILRYDHYDCMTWEMKWPD